MPMNLVIVFARTAEQGIKNNMKLINFVAQIIVGEYVGLALAAIASIIVIMIAIKCKDPRMLAALIVLLFLFIKPDAKASKTSQDAVSAFNDRINAVCETTETTENTSE